MTLIVIVVIVIAVIVVVTTAAVATVVVMTAATVVEMTAVVAVVALTTTTRALSAWPTPGCVAWTKSSPTVTTAVSVAVNGGMRTTARYKNQDYKGFIDNRNRPLMRN